VKKSNNKSDFFTLNEEILLLLQTVIIVLRLFFLKVQDRQNYILFLNSIDSGHIFFLVVVV